MVQNIFFGWYDVNYKKLKLVLIQFSNIRMEYITTW